MRSRFLLVVLTAAAMTAAGQQPTFRSGLELVQVDVVVVDKDGKHIRGLKAADFAVLDRKKAPAIATVEEVSHERLAAATMPAVSRPVRLDVGNNQSARSDRLVVIVIDDARDDVRAWVGRAIPANDRGRVDVKLPLSILATGAYRLRVTANDGTNTAARELGIVIK